MNTQLLKNFISKEDATVLAQGLRENLDQFYTCDQCDNTEVIDNYKPGVWLHAVKTKEISDVLGFKVIPTYNMARIYKHNTELPFHYDRESCEVTVSVHLSGDAPWDLYIEEKVGEQAARVTLDVGDACIYDGINKMHWRYPYTGQEYINLFLHYVKVGGQYEDKFFEKR